jgi:YD repeat-containing protein
VVATVDAAGYLIESDYDDQGNLVQQRKYEHPLLA